MTGWLSDLQGNTAAGVAASTVALLATGFVLSRLWSRAERALLDRDRDGRIDRMIAGFLRQAGYIFIWAVVAMLFAHAVPMLDRQATAMLASVSIAAVIVGLAMQSTLSNLVAGVGLTDGTGRWTYGPQRGDGLPGRDALVRKRRPCAARLVRRRGRRGRGQGQGRPPGSDQAVLRRRGDRISYAYQNVILHRAPPDAAADPAEPGRKKDGEPT
jgi:hypothetical protein